jgi:FMN phosphatase YigB (HAD superfamily)
MSELHTRADPAERVFLLDVDNTLLDNDRVTADLRDFIARRIGEKPNERYWAIFETLRRELGYADYLGALQRYRVEHADAMHVQDVSLYLLAYPFADRLYPGALDVIDHLRQWGPVAILSDGDVVFQPHKVKQSGLRAAVHERVMIYVHKEHMLADVERRFPARHYVMVDDKIRLLAAIKAQWRDRVTTVFVRQGHYALDTAEVAKYPAADFGVEQIGDLRALSFAAPIAPP